eukprot:7978346-Pyramimonas_sp.AAC.1
MRTFDLIGTGMADQARAISETQDMYKQLADYQSTQATLLNGIDERMFNSQKEMMYRIANGLDSKQQHFKTGRGELLMRAAATHMNTFHDTALKK